MENIALIISLLALGAVVSGILAGLLGIGGGIVLVPVLSSLYLALDMAYNEAVALAVGTSLGIIVFTGFASARAHHKRGNIVYEVLRWWSPFLILGTFLGAYLALTFGGIIAAWVYALVAVVVALNLFIRSSVKEGAGRKLASWIQVCLAFVIAAVSVLMGIGGGTFSVPALKACRLSSHQAVGTAAVFGLIIAIPGAVLLALFSPELTSAPLGTYGLVNVLALVCIAPISMLCAPLGAAIGARLSGRCLQTLFAFFLLVSALKMILPLIM